MDKDLEKCGCGCNDQEDHNHECGCGCGEHDHDNECGCGCGDEEESFVIDLEDEDGNLISCAVIDAFKFEEKEYLLAQNPEEDSVYLFRVDNEELIVPDEDEFERVSAFYQEAAESEE